VARYFYGKLSLVKGAVDESSVFRVLFT